MPFKALKQAGFKAIAFDKDNTLTAPYESIIHPPFQNTIHQIQAEFGSTNIVLVSNSAGSADDAKTSFDGAKRLEAALGIPILKHGSKKPHGSEALVNHFAHICQGHQIVVVGDRLTTDVAYAYRIGALAVLTKHIITETGDNWFAKHVQN